MSWTEERVELLKTLWAEGWSCSQIAYQLGGITRSAVIGKVHRLKLPGRMPRVTAYGRAPRRKQGGDVLTKRIAAARRKQQTSRLPAPIPVEDVVVPISLNVSLMALNDSMCKWPIGDPRNDDFGFCGHRNYSGLPYCEYHSRVAYQPYTARVSRNRQAEKDLAA